MNRLFGAVHLQVLECGDGVCEVTAFGCVVRLEDGDFRFASQSGDYPSTLSPQSKTLWRWPKSEAHINARFFQRAFPLILLFPPARARPKP